MFGHPDPAEGRIAIVTNAGWDVVDAGVVGAKVVCRAGHPVSERRAHTTDTACVRQNRVVLAPGVCAPSLAVIAVAQPGPQHQPSARRRGQ